MAVLEFRPNHPKVFTRLFGENPDLFKAMVADFMLIDDASTITDLELLELDVASSRIDGKPEVRGFFARVNGQKVYIDISM